MAEHTMNVDDGGRRERKMPVNYPANSKNPPPGAESDEKPARESVITGKVTRRSHGRSVVAETAAGVWEYVLNQVLLPSLKDTLYDVISGGSSRALFGAGGARERGGPRTNYSRYSRPGMAPSNPYTQTRTPSSHGRVSKNSEEVVLETRDQADAVLDALREIVKVYNQASVGDMLELCDIESVFTDGQWGWTDREIVNARIMPDRNGFVLRMPPTVPITN